MWDYGPLGLALKDNIKKLWWKRFVDDREDIFGVDTAQLMNQNVWKASGHVSGFSDLAVECEKCGHRFHKDQLSDKKKCPDWLDTETLLARFGKGWRRVKEYEGFMHCGVEKELREFYRERFQRPILGSKAFVAWVKEKIGERAKVEEEKPQSRRVFGLGLQEIVRATARVYGKRVEELGKKRRGYENEARAMAMYLCRTLGGYKLTEIGRVLGLEKYSSVSSACLAMKARVEKERRLARRVRKVERLLLKS